MTGGILYGNLDGTDTTVTQRRNGNYVERGEAAVRKIVIFVNITLTLRRLQDLFLLRINDRYMILVTAPQTR